MEQTNPSSVLIVEDDDEVRTALQLVVEDAGYNVTAVGDGRQAIDFLHEAKQRPCMILLDLMMPTMTGWEVLDELRKDDRLGGIPVAVVSAVSNPTLPRGIAYLKKPVDIDQIVLTLNSGGC